MKTKTRRGRKPKMIEKEVTKTEEIIPKCSVKITNKEDFFDTKNFKAKDATFVIDKNYEIAELPPMSDMPARIRKLDELKAAGYHVTEGEDNKVAITKDFVYMWYSDLHRDRTGMKMDGAEPVTREMLEANKIDVPISRYRKVVGAGNRVSMGDTWLVRKPVDVILEERKKKAKRQKPNDIREQVASALKKMGLQETLGTNAFCKVVDSFTPENAMIISSNMRERR